MSTSRVSRFLKISSANGLPYGRLNWPCAPLCARRTHDEPAVGEFWRRCLGAAVEATVPDAPAP
eukprot:11359728-Heterocapsa_arctica.AAC.1